ncbi:MAG: ATP-binding cassette domain-containing protein [Solirubrobacteraceae bacterium]
MSVSLLALEAVHKSYGRGRHRRAVLNGVSLEMEPGELVAIWGMRRSGRSTLLRIAAGLERADSGTVRFNGAELARHGVSGPAGEIAYCRKQLGYGAAGTVLDGVMESLVVRGARHGSLAVRARRALARAGVEHAEGLRPNALDGAEAIRVAIARALACGPSLLVMDDPTLGVDPGHRDEILLLLRSLADEGVAVLTNADRATGLAGANRALALGDGELRGATVPALAPVVHLRPTA